MRHLIVFLWLALPGTAMAFVGTQSTGDTGYGTTTTDPTGTDTDTGGITFPAIDTGPPACVDCLGAADLAGEQGGSSCTVAPASMAGWLVLGLVAGVARRR